MTLLPDHLGATLADELLKQSERDASIAPMDAVLDAAQSGTFTDDHGFRFLARLWTLKRMMYYVYGGWTQGINLNEYPPPSPIFSASKLTTSPPTRCSFAMKCYGAAPAPSKNTS